MKRVGYVAVWTAALLFTSVGIAIAQTHAAPQNMSEGAMMGSGSGMPMMGGPGHMGMMGMADHVEGRIAFLKVELNIAEAQMHSVECLRRCFAGKRSPHERDAGNDDAGRDDGSGGRLRERT